MSGDADAARVLARAAGEPELVSDLAAAVAGWRRRPGRPYLTLEGDGITAHGLIRAGGSENGAGLLALNRQRRQTANRAVASRAALPGLEEAAQRVLLLRFLDFLGGSAGHPDARQRV